MTKEKNFQFSDPWFISEDHLIKISIKLLLHEKLFVSTPLEFSLEAAPGSLPNKTLINA